VPQAIAYSQIAQLPPQAGLFAAFAGLLRGALRS
jgi:MFS superfamily sulfate permease-like transporter